MNKHLLAKTGYISCTLSMSFLSLATNGNDTIQPNLLIIHTDEHNFRTLGCYRNTLSDEQALVWGNNAIVETPNIDWLASNGVLCTSFYATTPVCSPSRASLVSGRYPQNTPVAENDIPLSGNIVTFAEILKTNGYATGYAGKWHLDGTGKPQWGPERQFGFEDNTYMFNRGHWKQLEDTPDGPRVAARNSKDEPSTSIDGATEENFTTDFLTNKTIEFFKEHRNEPFCYMLSLPDPHGPNTVRAPYDTMYNHIDFQNPKTMSKSATNLPSWAKKSNSVIGDGGLARYFGMVKCIDDNVGRILDSLRSADLMDSTIIIFTSDHGDLLREHKRDNKGVPFEASAKIPFIIYYPNMLDSGIIVNEAMSTVDFAPTILSLMGVETDETHEGRDVSDILINGSADEGWNDVIFMRGTGSKSTEKWVSAVSDKYKLVYAPDSKPWLIDLEKNPDETVNYYTDTSYKETIKSMAIDLKAYGETYNDKWVKNQNVQDDLDLIINGPDTTSTSLFNKFMYDVDVYPNPSSQFLQVKFGGKALVSNYEIFDIQGIKIYAGLFNTDYMIDIEHLKTGIYFIRLSNGLNQHKFERFVKL